MGCLLRSVLIALVVLILMIAAWELGQYLSTVADPLR